MSAEDSGNNILSELRQVKSSKVSLAEAMRQLDMVVQLGDKISQCCENQARIDNDFNHILGRLDNIATIPAISAIVDAKLAEFQEKISAQLSSFEGQIEAMISNKAEVEDIEFLQKDKVSYSVYKVTQDKLSQVSTQLDTAVTAMFEGFRTTVKNELAHKVSDVQLDKILQGKTNVKEMVLVTNRLDVIEKKVDEFGTDGDDSEMDSIYDEEEQGNFDQSMKIPLKDIIRPFPVDAPFEFLTSSRSKLEDGSQASSSAAAATALIGLGSPRLPDRVQEESKKPTGATHARQASVPVSTKPQTTRSGTAQSTPREPARTSQQAQKGQRRLNSEETGRRARASDLGSPRELLLTVDSERREKETKAEVAEMELLKVDAIPDVDTAPQKSPPPGPWTEPELAKSQQQAAPQAPAGQKSKSRPEGRQLKNAPVARSQTGHFTKSTPPGITPDNSSKGTAFAVPPDRPRTEQTAKRTKTSPPPSRHEQQRQSTGSNFNRQASRASTFSRQYGGKMNKGTQRALNDLFKMVTQLNKQCEEMFSDNTDMRREWDKTTDYLNKVNMTIEDMGSKMQQMDYQQSGILSGINIIEEKENEAVKTLQEFHELTDNVNKKMNSIVNQYKMANDTRAKRVIQLETKVDNLARETFTIKNLYKRKMTELTDHLKSLIAVKDRLKKDVRSIGSTVQEVQQSYQADYGSLVEDIDSMKGPLIDYISDSQHEQGTLGEEIMRQNEFIRGLAGSQDFEDTAHETLRNYQEFMDTRRAKTHWCKTRVKSSSPSQARRTHKSAINSFTQHRRRASEVSDGRTIMLPKFDNIMDEKKHARGASHPRSLMSSSRPTPKKKVL